MIASLSIGIVAAVLASGDAPGLDVAWTYHGAGRPVPITVTPPMTAVTLEIALLRDDGAILAGPAPIGSGEVDVRAALPEIDRLRRAAWLQLLSAGDPIGSPLVIQPMLSRLVPVTEDATNPSGITYTRVVGWYDETHPETRDDAARGGQGPADHWLAPDGADDRLFSGVRVWPDQDVILRTTHGDIRLAMRPDEAPNTTWNFLELCRGGFYRDIPFHRIVPMTPKGDPFVIQAGDPTPSGSGGPGYWLPIERTRLRHDFGVISMARDVDPDSAGSQIFICLSREGTARLDGHYCAFGETVEGTQTILDIADVKLADAARGRPAEPPRIVAAELVPAPPRAPGRGRPDAPVARPAPPEPTPTPDRVGR